MAVGNQISVSVDELHFPRKLVKTYSVGIGVEQIIPDVAPPVVGILRNPRHNPVEKSAPHFGRKRAYRRHELPRIVFVVGREQIVHIRLGGGVARVERGLKTERVANDLVGIPRIAHIDERLKRVFCLELCAVFRLCLFVVEVGIVFGNCCQHAVQSYDGFFTLKIGRIRLNALSLFARVELVEIRKRICVAALREDAYFLQICFRVLFGLPDAHERFHKIAVRHVGKGRVYRGNGVQYCALF